MLNYLSKEYVICCIVSKSSCSIAIVLQLLLKWSCEILWNWKTAICLKLPPIPQKYVYVLIGHENWRYNALAEILKMMLVAANQLIKGKSKLVKGDVRVQIDHLQYAEVTNTAELPKEAINQGQFAEDDDVILVVSVKLHNRISAGIY